MKADEKQATEEIAALCGEMTEQASEIESMLYTVLAVCQRDERASELFESIQRFSKVVGEDPFTRMKQTADGVILGNLGWSAERDGKRMPDYWIDYGVDGDWCYYLLDVKRTLDGSNDIIASSSEIAVFAECVDDANDKIARIRAALCSLVTS